jgi:hypothetical protein
VDVVYTYTTADSPKMVRETLCVAQATIGNSSLHSHTIRQHLNRLQRLIDDCDRQRPLGPDGKHGDRHTPTCGCVEIEELNMSAELPWARPIIGRRCKSRLRRSEGPYWGRCELAPHSRLVEHALERGMIWVRWADGPVRWEGPHYE